MIVKLIAPAGLSEFVDDQGRRYVPDATGVVSVDLNSADVRQFFRVGFVQQPHGSGATGQRPVPGYAGTPCYPGMPWFDLTTGLPIWRNAANTGWINASGVSV